MEVIHIQNSFFCFEIYYLVMSGPIVHHKEPNTDPAFFSGLITGCMTSGIRTYTI